MTCALGSVPSGGTATITLTATLDPAATGDISNTASVDSPTADPNNGNNSGTATGTTAPSADVSITKTMDPTTPVAGDPVTFTLSVRNAGPSTASAVTVRDQLDAALSGADATTTAGTCTVGGSGELACDLGDLASGGTAVITVTADLDPAYTGTLANTGTVSSHDTRPQPGQQLRDRHGREHRLLRHLHRQDDEPRRPRSRVHRSPTASPSTTRARPPRWGSSSATG